MKRLHRRLDIPHSGFLDNSLVHFPPQMFQTELGNSWLVHYKTINYTANIYKQAELRFSTGNSLLFSFFQVRNSTVYRSKL